MNDIKQFKSILKQGISRNTDVLLGCEFLEKLLNIINDYENTKNQLQQTENKIREAREYITSYESISIMQGLMNEYSNYDLDIKTMNEMIRRYMIVHDKILEILDADGGISDE